MRKPRDLGPKARLFFGPINWRIASSFLGSRFCNRFASGTKIIATRRV